MAQRFDKMSMEGLKGQDMKKVCPECGSDKIDHEKGEYICKKCGLVLD